MQSYYSATETLNSSLSVLTFPHLLASCGRAGLPQHCLKSRCTDSGWDSVSGFSWEQIFELTTIKRHYTGHLMQNSDGVESSRFCIIWRPLGGVPQERRLHSSERGVHSQKKRSFMSQ